MGKNKSKNQQKPSEQQQQQKPAQQQQAPKKASKVAEPLEVAAVPGFFGHELQPNQKLLWANEVEEFCLQLNSAALGASVTNGRSTLYVLAKEGKTALCTLTPERCEQFALSHTFTPLDGEIAFVVEGVNAIHLTGFIDVQDEDEDEEGGDYDGVYPDGNSDSESMDEDEEMMVFGDHSDDDDEDEDDEDDEDDEEDDEGRFEIVEERLHGDVKSKKEEKKPDAAATKKEATPAKKEATPAKKEATPAKKETTPAKKETTPAKKEATPAKKETSAKTEKKIAEKVAELTSANNKKRPAPSDSVEVPKKSKREYKGVTIEEHAVGKGQPVAKGRKVSILYKGRLENGKQFDANQNRKKPFTFRHGIGDVIKGMDIGIEGMRAGGKRTIYIPSKLGYGKAGAGASIPGNANLIFDIELL